jgi:hypothetical protein
VQRFAVVPEVMSREDWLRTRGNPNLVGKRGDPENASATDGPLLFGTHRIPEYKGHLASTPSMEPVE